MRTRASNEAVVEFPSRSSNEGFARAAAACFASQMSLANQLDNIPPDINIFPLYYKGKPVVQRLCLIRIQFI